MESEKLINILGKSSLDESVENTLRKFEILRRPHVTIDDEDMDGPVIESQDWVINSRSGIEFGFEDRSSFVGEDPIEFDSEEMLLTQIYLYGVHDGVNVYQGELPFGLLISDDRNTVRSKMISWESVRRSYTRDVWELPEYRMTISYVNEDAQIGFVLLWSRRDKLSPYNSSQTLPTSQKIIDTLGEVIGSSSMNNTFQQFPLEQYKEDLNSDVRFNLRKYFGFELIFIDNIGLIKVILYREREMDARGWKGALPNGLEFNDSPELLFTKMEVPPKIQNEDIFEGSAIWSFERYDVRVKYSTMKNYLLSIEISLPEV